MHSTSCILFILQALIKKHEAVEVEIEGYKGNTSELKMESEDLLKGDHFDADSIRKRQVRTYVRMWDSILRISQCY